MAAKAGRTWVQLLSLATVLVPRLSLAVELTPRDLVLFSSRGIDRLDPVTLEPTKISDGLGFGPGAHHMTVDHRGRLLVTDDARGVVEVSPLTGEKLPFVSAEALGGSPRGICLEASKSILVSVQSAPPRVIRIDSETRTLKVIAEGGMLIAPSGVSVAPGGDILVADQSSVPSLNSVGSLVRVNANTGEQARVAAAYASPQEVACSGDSVWVVNLGVGRRTGKGGLTITRLSDGTTVQASVGTFGSESVAIMPDGRIAYSACVGANGDCTSLFVSVTGSNAYLGGYMGTLAVVPDGLEQERKPLSLASPNPFRASTTLSYSLSKTSNVELSIYSVDGRLVTMLQLGSLEPGEHKVTWSGADGAGRPVRSGVYFARLKSVEGESRQTLVLAR
jgi:streptogramin lyase